MRCQGHAAHGTSQLYHSVSVSTEGGHMWGIWGDLTLLAIANYLMNNTKATIL